jgi:hypothetical protein
MHHVKHISGLALLATLAACSDKSVSAPPAPTVPLASTPAPALTSEQIDETLMKAVFGAQYRPKTRDAVAQLNSPYGETKIKFVLDAVAHSTLATGETVLLARSRYASPTEAEYAGKMRWIGVYFLRHEKDKWVLIRRHDNLTMFEHDSKGSIAWIKLGKGKEGIAITSTSHWDKCSDEAVTLFDLGDPALPRLNEPVATRSEASGTECNRFYDGSRWSGNGKWRMSPTATGAPYDDLVMSFSGHIESPSSDDQGQTTGPLTTSSLEGSARYAYDVKLKQYQLVEGKNPIPQVPEGDQG